MASTFDATVNALYLAYFGRPADPAGLAFWSGVLQKNNGDTTVMTKGFAQSTEAMARFSGDSTTERVTDIYQQMFGRAPDKAGLDFWVGAIDKGALNVGDAAIQIMRGAQSTDAQLSNLRQDLAAKFTAQVAADGIKYEGDAALSAARLLVSAVGANTKPADVDALLKAGASLVQTAHDSPAVIAALAKGGDLASLLSTAAGHADPVAMVQALATLGKAAGGDAANLGSLLKGGGVAGLLDSLQPGTSLKDVAHAVDQGGLAAGADVVNPPEPEPEPVPVADTTPPSAPVVSLVSDTGASATDRITKDGAIKVSGLEAGASWSYSVDKGTHWLAGTAIGADGSATLATTGTGALNLLVSTTDAAGNTSPATSFEYTVYKSLNGLLAVIGKIGADITTNSKGLNFSVMLAGHSDGVTTTYQVSSTGKADDFQAWDSAKTLDDGTYYFRATGSDLAGNSFTSNTVTVHLDNTAPPAPTGVTLVQDTGVDGDGITTNGRFVVSGLQEGARWQFSSDGNTWFAGSAVRSDGTAIGFAQASGEQTLQVRTVDLAGNNSEPVSLHFTLDDHLPMLGLSLAGADPESHLLQTTATKTDLVLNYTGTIADGDSFVYTPMFMGNEESTWTRIDSSMIDTVHKTITIKDFDLSSSDVFFTLRGTSLAGDTYYQASIDGPVTKYFTDEVATGLNVLLSGQFTAHGYLTDGDRAPVELVTQDESGALVSGQSGTLIGAQSSVVRGVFGAGNDAQHLSVNGASVYAFGTTAGDTLSGNFVWGFDGDDTITATGDASYNSSILSGGQGADVIHTETSASKLLYKTSQDSFIAADGVRAHGFDTVYVSNPTVGNLAHYLSFEGLQVGEVVKVSGAHLEGNETGTALLAAMNTAVAASFKAGMAAQIAFIDFGLDSDGRAVHFMAVDADKDGVIGSADFAIKIVGAIDANGAGVVNGDGLVTLHTATLIQ